MKIKYNSTLLSKEISANPSKSYEQRALAVALLSRSICSLSNVGKSDDVIAARDILQTLGSTCSIEGNKLIVSPISKNKAQEIFCNESALLARLFSPIACVFKNNFTLTGASSLLNRPVAEDFNIFSKMGCKLEYVSNKLPVVFSQANLKSGNYNIDGSKSSQLISGLIMSLPLIQGQSTLIISNPVSINYILMTIAIVKSAGISLEYVLDTDSLTIEIEGNQTYKAQDYSIEGDWSGASILLVAGAILNGVSIKGLNFKSLQADKAILKVFDLSDVKYLWNKDTLNVEKSPIKAFEFNATNCPDLIPALVVLASFAQGESKIKGAKRLLNKESSRGEVLVQEFLKLGVQIALKNDIIEVIGADAVNAAEVDSHGDHRIAMALAIAGLKSKDGIVLRNSESVAKSYPNFFEDMGLLT